MKDLIIVNKDKEVKVKESEFLADIVNTLDVFGDGSCIACYPFDGNAKDLSGKYNGTWHGNEQYDVGKYGKAAKFDGSSYITIPEPLKSLPFSVSVWIKTTQKATGSTNWANPTIMGFATSGAPSNDFGIEVKNGYIHIFSGFGVEKYYTTSKFVSDNKWHLITVNFNTNKCEIYCDDEFVDSFSQNSTQIANVPKWYIGCMYNYDPHHIGIVSGSYYQGLIDQVRIFNRALTEEEIQILYNEYEKIYQTDISSLNLSAKPKRVYIQTNPAIYISKTFNQDTSQPDWVSYQANLKEKLKEISIDTTQTTTTQLVTTDDIALNDKLILYNNSDGIKEITVTQDNLTYDVENDVVKVDISSLNLTQPPTKCFKNPTKISIAFGEDVNTNTYQPQEVEKREFNSTDNAITTTFKRFYDVDKAGRQFKVKLEGYCDTEVNELKVNLWTQETSK